MDTVLTNLQTSFNAIQLFFRGLQLLLNASTTLQPIAAHTCPPICITTLDGSVVEYVDKY